MSTSAGASAGVIIPSEAAELDPLVELGHRLDTMLGAIVGSRAFL